MAISRIGGKALKANLERDSNEFPLDKGGERSSGDFGQELLVNDTIGFIQDLPPELIDAFTSTLEDSVESDLLVHTIDAHDPKLDMKITVVNDILDQI